MTPKRTVIALALLVAGCATSGSVKQAVDPLAERISKLEARQAELDKQQADLKALLAQLGTTDQTHEVALTKLSGDVQGLRTEVIASASAAKDAQQAAQEARAATERAETAAS